MQRQHMIQVLTLVRDYHEKKQKLEAVENAGSTHADPECLVSMNEPSWEKLCSIVTLGCIAAHLEELNWIYGFTTPTLRRSRLDKLIARVLEVKREVELKHERIQPRVHAKRYCFMCLESLIENEELNVKLRSIKKCLRYLLYGKTSRTK